MSIASTTVSRRDGFTMVELLIVIVVVGILAAITIVAYNGIQQRANNGAITAAASQSIKAIQAYIAVNDAYPGTGNSCLTPTTGCIYGGNAVAANATVNANLATVASLTNSIPLGGHATDKGISYHYNAAFTMNGNAQPVRLHYWIIGNSQPCGLSNVANGGGFAMTTSTLGFTTSTTSATLCIISIPGPAT